ncbi:MAG: trypsin-like peptidase domain-containing protein [Planctomycetes bacterium]|nr:trypsin-like peptidase domain-containing protein [Planctomycetota bacterium]
MRRATAAALILALVPTLSACGLLAPSRPTEGPTVEDRVTVLERALEAEREAVDRLRLQGEEGRAALDFARIIREAKQQVFPVLVFVKPIREEFRGGERQQMQVFGSGVVISEDGYVVTNHHVAEKAVEIRCVLGDSEEVPADVVGLDPDLDIALLRLRLPPERLPVRCAAFGDSDRLEEGQFVMTMGSPLGLTRSISFGIISNTKRYLQDFSEYSLWIQTDAAINPGNSGGPLVDARGEIVGINTLGANFAENVGFSIPSNRVREVVELLREHGRVERAWTGIRLQALRDFMRSIYVRDADRGVLVASVDEGSPAEAAGLVAGDLVLDLAGVPVEGTYLEDLPGVRRRFAALAVGEPVMVRIRRSGEEREVSLVPSRKGKVEGDDFDCIEWNMTVKEINPFSDPEVAYFRQQGAYVLGVLMPGNAALSGVAMGDIILRLGERAVASLEDVQAAYAELDGLPRGRRKVLVEVLRDGIPQLLVLDFNKPRSDYKEAERQ